MIYTCLPFDCFLWDIEKVMSRSLSVKSIAWLWILYINSIYLCHCKLKKNTHNFSKLNKSHQRPLVVIFFYTVLDTLISEKMHSLRSFVYCNGIYQRKIRNWCYEFSTDNRLSERFTWTISLGELKEMSKVLGVKKIESGG